MATNLDTGVTPWFEDKKLYALVLSLLAPIIASKLGFQMNTDQIAGFVVVVVTFIASHAWKTTTIVKANIEAGAAVQSAAAKSPAAAADALNK